MGINAGLMIAATEMIAGCPGMFGRMMNDMVNSKQDVAYDNAQEWAKYHRQQMEKRAAVKQALDNEKDYANKMAKRTEKKNKRNRNRGGK